MINSWAAFFAQEIWNDQEKNSKQEARDNLNSETGKKMRSQRPVEVESVFGDIKGNFGVRRFLLRGLQKVGIEWGLHCMGHDMRKMAMAQG